MTNIAVIIPTYNRHDLLGKALDSVLDQKLIPDEILVVDDGSEDQTRELILKNYPQVSYYYTEHRGVSAARNCGILNSKAEWLAFLDSDDEWTHNKLQLQIECLQNNPQYLISHHDEIWIRNGQRINQMLKHQKKGGWIFQHCLPLCAISPSSVVIHRSVFEKIGLFDETLQVCEDYDLWLRITAQFPVLYIDKKLTIKYGGHADQLSNQYWGMDRYRIRRYRF